MLLVLSAAIVSCLDTAHAQTTNSPSAYVSLENQLAPFMDFERETRVLNVFLRASQASWNEQVKKLQGAHEEFRTLSPSVGSAEQRANVVASYREMQRKGIDRLINEFDFAHRKLTSRLPVPTIGGIRGIAASNTLAESASIIAAIADMETVHRRWRQLPDAPEMGTDAYLAWFHMQRNLEQEFDDASFSCRQHLRRICFWHEVHEVTGHWVKLAQRWYRLHANTSMQLVKLSAEGRNILKTFDSPDNPGGLYLEAYLDKCSSFISQESENIFFNLTMIPKEPPSVEQMPALADFDVVRLLRKVATCMGVERLLNKEE